MKKLTLALSLCLSFVASAQNSQNQVRKTAVSVVLYAAPLGDCRQQFYTEVVDNNLYTWECNTSTGAWTQTSFAGTSGSTGTGAAVLQSNATLITPNIELPVIEDTTDTTKQLKFSLSGGTTAFASTFTFAPTAARSITFPDASITVSGATLTSCGTSTSCASPATEGAIAKIVTGTTAFSSSTTLAITGMPAFTSITSFSCYASDPTHAYTWTASNQSSSAVTFTAGTSNSDSWQWSCIGY